MHKFPPVLWYTKQSVNKFTLVQVAKYTWFSIFQNNFCLYELLSLANLSLFSAIFPPVFGSGILSCAQVKSSCAVCADAGTAVACHLTLYLVDLLWNLLFLVLIILCRLNLKGIIILQIKHQLDATLCRFYFCRVTLHVSGVKRPSSGVLKNWHGGPWYRCYSCR